LGVAVGLGVRLRDGSKVGSTVMCTAACCSRKSLTTEKGESLTW
jgi:hypothetical protein